MGANPSQLSSYKELKSDLLCRLMVFFDGLAPILQKIVHSKKYFHSLMSIGTRTEKFPLRQNQKILSIKYQLIDRLANIIQGQMGGFFAKAFEQFRVPTHGQFF